MHVATKINHVTNAAWTLVMANDMSWNEPFICKPADNDKTVIIAGWYRYARMSACKHMHLQRQTCTHSAHTRGHKTARIDMPAHVHAFSDKCKHAGTSWQELAAAHSPVHPWSHA